MSQVSGSTARDNHGLTHLPWVLESMGEAVLVLDPHWRVVYANAAAGRLLLDATADNGRLELAEPASRHRLAKAMAVDEDAFELRLQGRGLWLELRTRRQDTHLVILARDITAQRQAQAALAESEHRRQILSNLTSDYAVSYRVGDNGALELEWRVGDFAGVIGHPSEQAPGLAQMMRFVHDDDREQISAALRRLLGGEPIRDMELRVIDAQGRQRWIRINARPIRDASGRVVRVVGAVQNVTERKRIEQVLRQSESWFRQAVEAMAVGVYVTDPRGRLLRCNQRACEMWGRTPPLRDDAQRYCGSSRLLTAMGRDLPHARCAMAHTLRTGEPVHNSEQVIERPDGSQVTVLVNASPVRDDRGRMIGAVNCLVDITEHRRAEQALRRSEARERARAAELTALMDSVPAVVFLSHDPRGDRITGSREAYEFLRVPPGGNLSRSAPGADRPQHFRVFQNGRETPGDQLPVQRAARGQWVHNEELEVRFADGSVRHLVGNACPVMDERGDVRGSLAAMIDITDRKAVEQQLRDSQQQLRITLEAAHVGTWQWDLRRNAIEWSANMEPIHGLAPGSFDGLLGSYMARVHAEDRQPVRQAIRRALAGRDEYRVEYRYHPDDGSTLWMESRGRVVRDQRGEPVRVTGVCINTTERKRAEQALRDSEQRFRAIFHGAQDPVLVYSVDEAGQPGAFLEVNDAAVAFYGYSERQFQSMTVRDLIVSSQILEHFPDYVQRLRRGESVLAQSAHRRRDGRTVDVEARAHLISLNGVTAILSVVRDITHHKRQQEQLLSFNELLEREVRHRTEELSRRATQLQAMAKELTDAEQRERRRLAQLLHDDLQQLLVAARLRLAAARGNGQGDVAQTIAEAEQLIGQSIETSRSLSTELTPPALHDLGLPAALRWLARWCRKQWQLEVEAHCADQANPDDEQVRVLIFTAVRELLLNVVKHAHARRAQLTLDIEHGQLACVVQDQGEGFDPAQARPAGSGFGLFSIQQRLELLGGQVHVDSAPGRGTRVRLTVPIDNAQA